MNKELITKKNFNKIAKRLEELHIRSWRMSRPIFPKMTLYFKVFPIESYFSTVGQIWWVTPYWRGDAFALSILFHEGHHWNIYPLDVFRAIKDIFEARRLLAEEIGFVPEKIQKSLWRVEEDWSQFAYSTAELQFVENILGDYLVNTWIHDNYPLVWNDLWRFLSVEGTFYEKEKALKRDTTFLLYLAVYPELIPGLEQIPVKEKVSEEKIPKIAHIVKLCKEGRISTPYAIKELAKLFHDNIQQDLKEAEGEGKEGDFKCPKCHSDEGWEIVSYFDEQKGKWLDV